MQKSKIIFPIYLTYFLDFLGMSMVFPFFAPLLLQEGSLFFSVDVAMGTKEIVLGLVLMCFPLAQFFGAPIFGDISDRVGRKKSLIVSIIGTFVGYIITAMAIDVNSLGTLFFGRLMTGLFAGNTSICLAAIADISPTAELKSSRYGQMSFLGGISFIFGVFFGGILSSDEVMSHFTASTPLWFTATLGFFNVFIVLIFFKETLTKITLKPIRYVGGISHILQAFTMPKLRFLFAYLFFLMTALELMTIYIPVIFFKDFALSRLQIGLVFPFYGVFWAIGASFIGPRLIKKFSLRGILTFGSYILAFILFLLIFTKTFWAYLGPSLFTMLLFAILWPATNSLLASNAEVDMQGKVMGLASSMAAVGAIIAALAGGILIGLGSIGVYSICIVSMLLGGGALWAYKKTYEKA